VPWGRRPSSASSSTTSRRRELDLGFIGLAEFAPAALLVFVTGAVADRRDRRRVASVAATAEALASVALAAYVATGPTAVGPVFLLVVVLGTCRAFAAPAARSLPADIVEPARLPWLVARFAGTWQLALVAGPVAAGVLYTVGPAVPFLAAAASFLVAALAYLFIRVPAPVGVPPLVEAAIEPVVGHAGAAPEQEAGLADAFEGLRFIRGHPVLLGAIALDLFAVLFGGAVALLPAIAEDRLGVGAVGLGWLRAAGGIGAAAMTVLLAVRPLRRRVGRTLLVAVAIFGAATVVLGVTRSFAVAFVMLLVLSGADAVSVFIRATLVPLVTPRSTRGRVLAVENVFIGASNELGAFESGVAGQVLGPAGAVVLGGAATMVVAAAWWGLFPDLRDVDGFPDRGDET
jgi:predicted MFS family arabinose efflux permease